MFRKKSLTSYQILHIESLTFIKLFDNLFDFKLLTHKALSYTHTF